MKLTRAQMEAAIRNGGSVMAEGKIITKIEELPSEAELAKGDESREQAVIAQLLVQKAGLEQQLAQLQGGQQTPASQVASTETEEKKSDPNAPPDGKANPGPAPEAKTDPSANKANDPKTGGPRK